LKKKKEKKESDQQDFNFKRGVEKVKRLSLTEVTEILLAEKRTTKLTKLDPLFLGYLNETIDFLSEKRREAVKEDRSTDFEIYDEELKKMRALRRQILNIREKKIIDLAWSAGKKEKMRLNYLLPEERRLYDSLVLILTHWRESLNERKLFNPVVSWGGKDLEIVEEVKEAKDLEEKETNLEIESKEAQMEEAKEESPFLVVSIISDKIQPFVDDEERIYDLKKGDVATVPRKEAELLIKNKLAKEIKVRLQE